MDDLFTFIGFLISVCFFIWFGRTLNSINRNLERLAEIAAWGQQPLAAAADHAERQTKLIASIANRIEEKASSEFGTEKVSGVKPPYLGT